MADGRMDVELIAVDSLFSFIQVTCQAHQIKTARYREETGIKTTT